MSEAKIVLACTPNAVPAEDRPRWMSVGQAVYGAVEEVVELPDGYALRLPSDAATLLRTAEYVSLDRLCCAFLRFELCVEPGGHPLWLRLTGPEGAKETIRAALESTALLNEPVARAAGFSVDGRRAVEGVVAAI